jgi:orotidine-5'-phosphate decarboxylase
MAIEEIFEFNRAIVEATSDLVCAYKPNLAFYEAAGIPGLEALQRTLECIPDYIPVIGDAKRGDAQPSSRFYARAMFEVWGFDAVTVNGYLGGDALEPFLAYPERGVLVLCRTSNPGARELQDLISAPPYGGDSRPLFEWVAMRALAWNDADNVGLVVGATYPDELRRVREICATMPILVPGIGAQGGSLQKAVEHGVDDQGRNLIISASRSVLYASSDAASYPEAARAEAERLRVQISDELSELGVPWGDG